MKERIFTTKEQGRGRGVAGVGRGCEASKCTGVNWYIITYETSNKNKIQNRG